MKVVFPIALGLLVFCTPHVVLSEEVGKAEITRLKYDEQLAQILVKQEGRINELMGKYGNELGRMNAIYRQASNLEGVLAVMGEIERVKSERSISAEQINQTHPELASLQNKVLGYYGVIRKAEAGKIVRLAQAFRRSMKSLQTQLTREGKIAEAVVTKEMIEEILEGSDYVSAKEYLVAKPAPPVDSAGSPAHAGDGDEPPPDGEAEEEGPRFGLVTIYPKGSEPKRTAKKEAVYHTGTDSIAAGSKIIATVQKITEEKTTSRSRDSEYSTRNIKKAYIPRLVFMAGPSHNFKDATILFEYFTRQGNTRSIVKSDRARIPMLQSMKYMVADAEGYANVITKTETIEVEGGSFSRSSEKPEYYGFIASIYDRKGTLIFQRCTNRSLAEFGKSTLEMLR